MDSNQVIEVCQADYNNDNPISIDGIARCVRASGWRGGVIIADYGKEESDRRSETAKDAPQD